MTARMTGEMTIKLRTASPTAAVQATAVTPVRRLPPPRPDPDRGRGAIELRVPKTPLAQAPANEARHVETPPEATLPPH
jgi:hypothetical protein